MVAPNNGNSDGNLVLEPRGNDVVWVTYEMSFPDDLYGPYEVSFQGFLEGSTEEAVIYGQTVFIDMYDVHYVYSDKTEIPVTMSVSVEDACETVVADERSFTLMVEEP